MKKIKTKSGMFFLGLILQALLTVISFSIWGITDEAHVASFVATFLTVAAIPSYNYYFGKREMGGRHFWCGIFGMVIIIVATLLLWF